MKYLKIIKEKRSKEKEILKKIEEEEKALEQIVNEQIPEAKFSIKETIGLLKGEDEEEREYKSYLTEEELKEEERKNREERKIIKIAATTITVAIIVVMLGSKIFYDTFKSDLLKVTEPILKEHYYQKTGSKAKTKTIEELLVKGEDNIEKKTGIYLLTTKDDKHIMSVNNVLIGDDINNSKKYKEVKEFIKPYLGNIELVTDDIKLSYEEYYLEYNRFLDYINVLPSNLSCEELINSNKLTVTYQAVYQGELDLSSINELLNKLSQNSTILLYKQTSSGITNLTIVKNNSILSLNITAEIHKETGITYLELDRNLNSVNNIEIHLFSASSANNIKNPIRIKKEEQSRDEGKSKYYLLRLDSGLVNDANFVELSTYKKDDKYEEMKKEDYEDAFLLTIGSYTYLLSENDMVIGKISGKKSFLCNLGIC